MIRIVVVDDETLFRRGLIACVNWEEHDMQIVGEASNGQEALAVIRKLRPDVVLLDIKMPVLDGVEVVRTIVPELPDVYFIMLSCLNEFEYVKNSMKLGARDYLFKPVVCEQDILASILELFPRAGGAQAQPASDDSACEEGVINADTVQCAVTYMQQHFSEPITLEDIARAACMSKNYFCRIFREKMNFTPMEYLTRIRMQKADELILETRLPMRKVCSMVGFNDYVHFCKTYKKITGKTPGQRRRMC